MYRFEWNFFLSDTILPMLSTVNPPITIGIFGFPGKKKKKIRIPVWHGWEVSTVRVERDLLVDTDGVGPRALLLLLSIFGRRSGGGGSHSRGLRYSDELCRRERKMDMQSYLGHQGTRGGKGRAIASGRRSARKGRRGHLHEDISNWTNSAHTGNTVQERRNRYRHRYKYRSEGYECTGEIWSDFTYVGRYAIAGVLLGQLGVNVFPFVFAPLRGLLVVAAKPVSG
jgi:hypothetical protein